MLKQLLTSALALGLILPALTGCNMARHRRDVASAAPAQPREAVAIFGPQGERIAWGTMLETASQADVIIIGETHGHPTGLAAAAALWDDILERHPDAALLLEFFERDQQVALDDYLSGITNDEDFRKAANRTAGNFPPGHEQMVDAAKAADRPVYAANAPRRYVRKTTPEGYETLTALGSEQQRLFVVPDALIEGKYKDDFYELMGGSDHGPTGEGGGMPPEMLDKIYRSQQLWDSTMADSVVRAANAGAKPALLVVGRFHSDFDGGTVQYIQRRNPSLSICTLSMVASDAPELDEEDLGRADFVLHVGPSPE